MAKQIKLRFNRDGELSESFLEKLEDSGYGDLTEFYGTEKDEKKVLKKLLKRLNRS